MSTRFEYLDGVPHELETPSIRHQTVLLRLAVKLHEILADEARGSHRLRGQVLIAPVEVILTQGDTVQPDLLAVRTERSGIVGKDRVLGAPDLIVEILSVSTQQRDRGPKRALYEHSGVQEYWIVDPEARRIEILDLVRGRYEARVEGLEEIERVAFSDVDDERDPILRALLTRE